MPSEKLLHCFPRQSLPLKKGGNGRQNKSFLAWQACFFGLKGGAARKISFVDKHSKNVLFLVQVSNGRSFQPDALFKGLPDASLFEVGGIRLNMFYDERRRDSYGF